MSEILSGRHQHFPGRGFFCKPGLEQVRPTTRWELAECRAYLAGFIIYFHIIFIIYCNKLIFNTHWFVTLFNLLSSRHITQTTQTTRISQEQQHLEGFVIPVNRLENYGGLLTSLMICVKLVYLYYFCWPRHKEQDTVQ